MRLIDADELYNKLMYDTTITYELGGGEYIARWRVGEAIETAPTVEVEPIVHNHNCGSKVEKDGEN